MAITSIGFVGSRKFHDATLVERVVRRLAQIHGNFVLVSGGADGADITSETVYRRVMAELYPDDWHMPIIHYPDSSEAYEAFGDDFRARAFGRNFWITRDSDILVAFYSTAKPAGGTLNTHNHARRKGIPIYFLTNDGRWAKENI